MLNMRFLEGICEVWAGVSSVATLSTMETESLFEASLLLFWGEFLWDGYAVDIHGIEVFGTSGG